MSKFAWKLNSYDLIEKNHIWFELFFNQIFTEDFSKKYYNDFVLFQFIWLTSIIIQVPLNKTHSFWDRKMKNVQGILNR